MRAVVPLLLVAACVPPDAPLPDAFPDPDAWGPTSGPGAPRVSFAEEELFTGCATLPGDPARDADHHDLVVMYDGWLVLPWAPEDGVKRLDRAACGLETEPTPEEPGDVASCPGTFGGGLTFWDVSDPCAPVKVGEGWTPWMRETHSVSFATVGDRTYAAVNFLAMDGSGGVGFWDITDVTAPVWVGQARIPGHAYPDSYLRVTLSVFWQYPYVYVSTALNGVGIVDATDPTDPVFLDAFRFDGIFQAGTFHVWGNRAMASSAGIARTVLVDLSDPLAPEPAFAGDFTARTPDGRDAPYYFANIGARHALFASSQNGGTGPIVYEIPEGAPPVLVAAPVFDDGEGAYVFQHEDLLFLGESTQATIYDFSDPSAPTRIGHMAIEGDNDFVTPIGNVAVVSVDEDAEPGAASVVFPWRAEPDARPPRPGMTSPADGATGQALTTRIGVAFDEMVEPRSAFPGSFRVATEDGRRVDGVFQVQENLVNFSPSAPLQPETTYVVVLPAGGIADLSGNALAEELRFSFTTGAR